MPDPAVIELHDPESPLDVALLEANLNVLIGCVNQLASAARFQLPEVQPGVSADGNSFRVVGALTCESLTVGDGAAEVIADDRLATQGRAGALLQAAAVAPLGTLSGTPAEQVAAIGAKVNEVLGVLRASGQLAEV